MTDNQLRYIIDEKGNHTAVILDIDMFDAMLDSLEELETFYFSHHPEEKEARDAELDALMKEEEQ